MKGSNRETQVQVHIHIQDYRQNQGWSSSDLVGEIVFCVVETDVPVLQKKKCL